MQTNDELIQLLRQRTWDKELLLWFGPEAKLMPLLAGVHVDVMDLLDLFDPANLPADDDDIRQHLLRSLRQRLRAIAREPGRRTVLTVRSAGLLARYRVGVQDFYDWFCDDFAVVILLVEGTCSGGEWPDEVRCDPDRLVEYFTDSGMVKRQIGV